MWWGSKQLVIRSSFSSKYLGINVGYWKRHIWQDCVWWWRCICTCIQPTLRQQGPISTSSWQCCWVWSLIHMRYGRMPSHLVIKWFHIKTPINTRPKHAGIVYSTILSTNQFFLAFNTVACLVLIFSHFVRPIPNIVDCYWAYAEGLENMIHVHIICQPFLHPQRTLCNAQRLSVCLLATLHKNYWTDRHGYENWKTSTLQ